MKKRSRKKIWTAAAALALVVALLPFVGLGGSADNGGVYGNYETNPDTTPPQGISFSSTTFNNTGVPTCGGSHQDSEFDGVSNLFCTGCGAHDGTNHAGWIEVDEESDFYQYDDAGTGQYTMATEDVDDYYFVLMDNVELTKSLKFAPEYWIEYEEWEKYEYGEDGYFLEKRGVHLHLCLNGYVLSLADGAESERLFEDNNTAYDGCTWSITDCTDTTHKFIDSNGDKCWELKDDADESDVVGTVIGGVITGGKDSAVYVNGGSGTTMNLYRGNIVGNCSDSDSSGGGVFVYGSNLFNMYGGSIQGNLAGTYGSGIFIQQGEINIYDGTIAHNHANDEGDYNIGSGVYIIYTTANMYGGTIKDNTCKQGAVKSNVYVYGREMKLHGSDFDIEDFLVGVGGSCINYDSGNGSTDLPKELKIELYRPSYGEGKNAPTAAGTVVVKGTTDISNVTSLNDWIVKADEDNNQILFCGYSADVEFVDKDDPSQKYEISVKYQLLDPDERYTPDYGGEERYRDINDNTYTDADYDSEKGCSTIDRLWYGKRFIFAPWIYSATEYEFYVPDGNGGYAKAEQTYIDSGGTMGWNLGTFTLSSDPATKGQLVSTDANNTINVVNGKLQIPVKRATSDLKITNNNASEVSVTVGLGEAYDWTGSAYVLTNPISETFDGITFDENGEVTFTMGANEEKTLDGLPAGAYYFVKAEAEGYSYAMDYPEEVYSKVAQNYPNEVTITLERSKFPLRFEYVSNGGVVPEDGRYPNVALYYNDGSGPSWIGWYENAVYDFEWDMTYEMGSDQYSGEYLGDVGLPTGHEASWNAYAVQTFKLDKYGEIAEHSFGGENLTIDKINGTIQIHIDPITKPLTVNFGGDGPDEVEVSLLYGGSVRQTAEVDLTENTSYTFAGVPYGAEYKVTLEAAGYSAVFTNEEGVVGDGDLTPVTCTFTPNEYAVMFMANNGTDETKTQMFTYDEAEKLVENTFTNGEKEFKHWKVSGVDTTYADKAEVVNLTGKKDGIVYLFAIWEGDDTGTTPPPGGEDQTTTHSVTFKSDNKTVGTLEVADGSKILEPKVEKSGHTLVGWKDDGGRTWNFKNDTVTSDLTLTAEWKKDSGGGSGSSGGSSGGGGGGSSSPTVKPPVVDIPVEPPVVDLGAEKFGDVDPNAWYYEAVDYVVENGIMQGISDAIFDPNGTASRAEIITTLWRIEGKPVVSHPLYFSDVSEGLWYIDALRWTNSENIVLGYDDGRFGTNDPVTREQIATILWRYARFKGIDTTGNGTSLLKFFDAEKISAYAISALQWACGEELIEGTVDKTGAIVLDPQGSATRAQIAAILMRFCENIL